MMILSVLVLIVVAAIVSKAIYSILEKDEKRLSAGEILEKKKEKDIQDAKDKIDSGGIEFLVGEHNSEIANRDKKD